MWRDDVSEAILCTVQYYFQVLTIHDDSSKFAATDKLPRPSTNEVNDDRITYVITNLLGRHSAELVPALLRLYTLPCALLPLQ